jgi:hypothetical protein
MNTYPTQIILNFKDQGSAFKGIAGHFSEMVGGEERYFGTRRVQAGDIEALLPSSAAMLAQIDDLLAKLEAETKAREAAEKERDEATAAKVAAEADRDAKVAAAHADRDVRVAAAEAGRDAGIAAEAGKVAALEARIAELTAAAARSIHKAYLRAALADPAVNKLAQVDAAVQAAGPVKWELWANATTISQDDPDVNAIASALDIDLDAVFTAARALREAR